MLNRLNKCREQLGFNQEDFANTLGIKRPTLSNWEIDIYDIPLKWLVKISNKYNYSIDYILCLNNENIKYSKINSINKDIISKNLKSLRDKHNYTEESMADIAGIATSTYSRYERAINTTTSKALYSLCKHFNVSMDEMLGREKILN